MCDRTKNNVFYSRDTREKEKKKKERSLSSKPMIKKLCRKQRNPKANSSSFIFFTLYSSISYNHFFFFPNNQTELKKNMQWDLKAWISQWTNKKINPYINYQEHLPKIVKNFRSFFSLNFSGPPNKVLTFNGQHHQTNKRTHTRKKKEKKIGGIMG